MTTKTKVDLYIANNLEELNKRVEDNPLLEKVKLTNCANITHIIETTWAEAKKSETNSDEERAYILYMRLFACLTALTQAKDAANNQDTIKYYKKGALIWIEKAGALSESLKARYEEKNAAKFEEEKKLQAEIDEEKSLQKSIRPKLLYKYLYEKKKTILLIDMRLKANYDQSHMLSPACINIPADLMNGKGWTSWGVESTLTDNETVTKFKQRADYDYIILFDDDSYENSLKPGSCLLGLKQAIYTLDRDVKLKREPIILDGGYEDWTTFYPGLNSAPLILKKNDGELRSFEVSYPEDEILSAEVPPNAATVAQPEATAITPVVIPQIDRTRKPINNQKPESPVIEQEELPTKPIEEKQPPIITKEQPSIPDRTTKPIASTGPTSSVTQEIPPTPTIADIPPRPLSVLPTDNNITPEVPKPLDTPKPQTDINRENIPPKIPLPNRETLSIYRPFNRPLPIKDTNNQYQKKFDAVTGRKIILDTKTNNYINNLPETESEPIKPSTPIVLPTVNRDVKPLLTEQTRRQIAINYQATCDNLQINRRTGLKNLGNSCYMNSIIQSLSFNFVLTNYFLSGEFSKYINKKNKFGSGGDVTNEWFHLNVLLWSQQYSHLVPVPFKYTVGKLQQAYLGTQQQDAHEFLIFLLDSLHEDLNQATRPRLEELKSENYPNDKQLAEATKQAFGLHNKSIIIDLFYGLFKSTTICQLCSYKSIRFDAFAIISVPIPPLRQCSLDDCLDLFREYETLTGEQRYECSKCKRSSDKKRRLDIWELPQIFIVHFKRFRLRQNHYIKNETLIQYPISDVDFSPWSIIPSKEKYNLISVVNHYGSMNCGHYTSYCNDGKQWYYCDDHSIRQADTRELRQNVHAYLLFYSSKPQPQLNIPSIFPK